jgi:hypothetical protein
MASRDMSSAAPVVTEFGQGPIEAEITIEPRRSTKRKLADAGWWFLHGCGAAAGYHADHLYVQAERDRKVE